MPWDQVMHKFKNNQLTSGSKGGPKVKNRKQAIAIMLSEKKKAQAGNAEYQPKGKSVNTGPSKRFMRKFGM